MTPSQPGVREAALATLAALPRRSPARVRRLLAAGDPVEVLAALIDGAGPIPGVDPEVWDLWHRDVAGLFEEVPARCVEAGVKVVAHGDPGYPVALLGDPWAPPVLFVRGDLSALSGRRVGIVGTRTATHTGRHLARVMGEDLAREGICVVSGLARGIDVAAHVGALAGGAAPVAVVASGCDVPYPPEHRRIWEEVAVAGALVSEAPPGTSPTPRMFPQRNRILAGLSEVVVVVESRARGGSMITVREAAKRDIPVMAVPGSTASEASEGTNLLLADGCAPVTDARDILVALGLDTSRVVNRVETRPPPEGDAPAILAALRGAARTVDEIALTTGIAPLEVAVTLGRLEAHGWAAHSDGWWESLAG